MLINEKFSWADIVLCAADFPQFSATTSKPAQKRKRSSEPRPSKPSQRWSQSAISPADLPVVTHAPSRQQPSSQADQLNTTAGNQNHDALKIHKLSVEEYQQVYHEEVDGMLR